MNITDSVKDITVKTIKVQSIGSTNNYLIELCDKGCIEDYTTVWCDFQTSGKGQRGNSWESENGKNLTFSTVVFPKDIYAAHQFIISMITANTIKDVLSEYTDDIMIKWPNDIYWKDSKICGILIENDLQGMFVSRSVLGIGVNVNQEIFLSDAPNPISLCNIIKRFIPLEEVLSKITSTLASRFSMLKDNSSLEYQNSVYHHYMDSLYRKDGYFIFEDNNGRFIAKIKNVEFDGHLVLEDMTSITRRYAFKEVQFII